MVQNLPLPLKFCPPPFPPCPTPEELRGGTKIFSGASRPICPPPELNPVSAPVYIYIYMHACIFLFICEFNLCGLKSANRLIVKELKANDLFSGVHSGATYVCSQANRRRTSFTSNSLSFSEPILNVAIF